jgi:hypothetical protein
MSAVAGLLMLPVLLLTTTAEVSAAAFSGTLSSQSNRFAAAPDLVPPDVGDAIVALTDAGVPGWVSAGRPYRVYTHVTDTGNPASGVHTVYANLSTITSGASEVPLTPGNFSVGGVEHNYRSSELIADAAMPEGPRGYSITALDHAGNESPPQVFSVQADNSAPQVAATSLVSEDDGVSHRLYAQVSDSGGSGLASAGADLSELGGPSSLPLTSSGGPWEEDGITFSHRSDTFVIDAESGDLDYTVWATDWAGNSTSQGGSHNIPVPPPTDLVVSGACTSSQILRRSTPSTNTVRDSTSITISRPASVQAGDLLVAELAVYLDSASGISAPPGWTLVLSQIHPSDSRFRLLAYTRYAASEPTGYTWNLSGGDSGVVGGIVAYHGTHPTDPVAAAQTQTGTGSTVTAPSVTPGWEHGRLLAFASARTSNNFSYSVLDPLWSLHVEADRGHLRSGAGEEVLTSRGPTGNRTASIGSTVINIGAQVVIRPQRWTTVNLAWTGTEQTSYVITRTGGTTQQWTVPAGTTTWQDGTASPYVTYDYYVRAVQGDQQSDPATASINLATCPLGTP